MLWVSVHTTSFINIFLTTVFMDCRIEYKATVPIPPDKMALLDEVPRLPSNTKVFLIGKSEVRSLHD